MADLTSFAQTYDNAGSAIAASYLSANNYKLLGDGASGVGPYTRFGTRQLAALKIVSTAINETTTPAIRYSNLQKIINALQGFTEIYYVGVPDSDFITVLVAKDTLNAGGTGADRFGGTADTTGIDGDGTWATAATFESIETVISLALGQAVTDVEVTAVTLTGGTFA